MRELVRSIHVEDAMILVSSANPEPSSSLYVRYSGVTNCASSRPPLKPGPPIPSVRFGLVFLMMGIAALRYSITVLPSFIP